MIVFDLHCALGHSFEGWFRSHEDFSQQIDAGIVNCPDCGSDDVKKGFSAPHLARSTGKSSDESHMNHDGRTAQGGVMIASTSEDGSVAQAINAPGLPAEIEHELRSVFGKIRKHVEKTCDYVGDRFAEEARRMHYGETDERGIYGEASMEETAELVEEGINVMPIPGVSGKTDA